MGYEGEYASKASHFDLVENPEVQDFLNSCDYLAEPSEEQGDKIRECFKLPPSLAPIDLPNNVIAIDGSRHESAVQDRLPSTRFGYVKVSAVLINLGEYGQLRSEAGFVNPFEVAKLEGGHDPLAFALPSSNVRWGDCSTVEESFRSAVDHHLESEATWFNPSERKSSLRSTLFEVASRRPKLGTDQSDKIRLPKCVNRDCDNTDIVLDDSPGSGKCPECNEELFPSDSLRLWEEVGEYQSNQTAITRFMNVVEHLLPIHLIRCLREAGEFDSLSDTAFVIDGPLAFFGTVAPLHRGVLSYLNETNQLLMDRGRDPILFVGIQKNGHLVEHADLMERFVPKDRLLLVDDDYRFTHVLTRDPSDNGFGSETYYGQDFIYRTRSGRTFVFALPFPSNAKTGTASDFIEVKAERSNYPTLARALRLIGHFESDLYRNSVVPVALAHRYTAISLRPGGRVLDLLTRQEIVAESGDGD